MSKKVKKSSAKSPRKHVVRKKSSSQKLLTIKILFCIGLALLSISCSYYIHQLIQLSFFNETLPQTTAHITARPIEIRIPTVNIDLSLSETVIANNVWQIADNGASHLALSGRPGEATTDIIYAHNTNDRFGPLLWLSVGDDIILTTADKKEHTYHITQIVTVDPNKPGILTTQKGETLILYTCTGFADLQRYVLIAKPGK